MLIRCWLNNVKRVEITAKPKTIAGVLVSAPIVKVLCGNEYVDPFATYYSEAKRHSRFKAPHHAFANVTVEEAIAPFLERFGFPVDRYGLYGFPSLERRNPLLVSEVLIEAKRLRLLMEAWDAFESGELPLARQRLGEVNFACHWNAQWFYWQPTLFRPEAREDQEKVRILRQDLEREFNRASEAVATYTTSEGLYSELVSATERVCIEPLREVQFTPEIEWSWTERVSRSSFGATRLSKRRRRYLYDEPTGLNYSWSLNPVRVLGETQEGEVIEQLYIAAPYALMFLLEKSSGVETRVCGDPFCREIFAAERRNQKYCSMRCAHRVAVSNDRRRKREAAGARR